MNASEKNAAGQARKAYHSPIVRYYGAIRTITENIGNMGSGDGGTVSLKKKSQL